MASPARGTSCPASAGGQGPPPRGCSSPGRGGEAAEPASGQGKIKAERKKKKRKKKREREGFPLSQGGISVLAGHAAGFPPKPWGGGGGVSCPAVQEGNKRKSIPNKSKPAKAQPKRENTHWELEGLAWPGLGRRPLPRGDRDAPDLPLSTEEDFNLSPWQPPNIFPGLGFFLPTMA